jgi:serine phosphatase RsbU (regulator of sigma subunit)
VSYGDAAQAAQAPLTMEQILDENRRLREQLEAKSRIATKALATYQQRVLQMEEHAAALAQANQESKLANERLQSALRHLEEKDRRITEDLQQAWSFQQRILPRLPPPGRLAFSVIYRPAELVGGDIFDVVQLGEGHFRVFIADATGHGVQAALRTMILKSEYDRIKDEHGTPESLMAALNRRLTSLFPQLELQCSGACFDLRLGAPGEALLRYATAAHPPLLHISADGAREIYQAGPFLGVIDPIALEPVEVQLRAGDRLFAYSDGLIEQWGRSEQAFGVERVLATLSAEGQGLDESLARLMGELEQFLAGEDLADDATVVGVAFTG